jgi:preprotein translocase SecE subunit
VKIVAKIKDFLQGIIKEARRVRWPRGEELQKMVVTVLSYAFFFGLALFVYDFFVIQLLRFINFS